MFNDYNDFIQALFNNQTGENTTLDERKKYLLHADKPLVLAFEKALDLEQDADLTLFYNTASTWLKGFSVAQKREALTPIRSNSPTAKVNENAIIVQAFNKSVDRMVCWLLNHGVRLPVRLHQEANKRQIKNLENVSSESVEITVQTSLQALAKAQPLDAAQVKSAASELFSFIHKRKQDADEDNIELDHGKHAIQYLMIEDLLDYAETTSGLTVGHLLAYFWINLQHSSDQNAALNCLYQYLTQIVRAHCEFEHEQDSSSCYSGIINFLTIALQAVCPQLVWITHENEQSLAIKALNALPELIQQALNEAADKFQFAHLCENSDQTKVLPNALLQILLPGLKQKLGQFVYNYNFNPARCCAANDEDAEALINASIDLIKAGKAIFPSEMLRPAAVISDLLNAITLAANKCIPNNADSLINKLHSIQQQLKQFKPSVTNNCAPAAAPRTQLTQYNLFTKREVVLKPADEQLFDTIYAQGCYATDPDLTTLPAVFKGIARETFLLQRILKLLNDSETRCKQRNKKFTAQIYLYDLFNEFSCSKTWLQSKRFAATMQALRVPAKEADQQLDRYLFDNSPAIYGALFRISVEALKQPIKENLQQPAQKRAFKK